jgi:hypothetical protein
MKAALLHDLIESLAGDTPGPAKRALFESKPEAERSVLYDRFGHWVDTSLHPLGTKEIIKFADLMDEAMFLATEYQLGNRSLGNPDDGFVGNPHAKTVIWSTHTRLRRAWDALYPFTLLAKEDLEGVWSEAILKQIHGAYSEASYAITDGDTQLAQLA